VVSNLFKVDPHSRLSGRPEGYPEQLSVHDTIHAVAPPIAFLSIIAAYFAIARRFSAEGMRRAAVLTRILAVACFVLSVPVGPGASGRLFVAVALAFGWMTAYAVYLRRG
jgi:hypothetical membrane protein